MGSFPFGPWVARGVLSIGSAAESCLCAHLLILRCTTFSHRLRLAMSTDLQSTATRGHHPPSPRGGALEVVIGLEVHVQLATGRKLFCRCPCRFGARPNALTCPVCLGYPGALPVLDPEAVDLAVRLSSALGAQVHEKSVFERKSYFYPDLPKGYQITQRERPLATKGELPLSRSAKKVAIDRLHLEEDAGKLVHTTTSATGSAAAVGASRVDFNRCGAPLVEIVSAPELSSPEEAEDYLRSLHQVLRYTATSKAILEEGGLRCDANLSLRRVGSDALGTRTEIKNLNSFRNVARALGHEARRQRRRLDQGERIDAETRGFDAAAGSTYRLRGKEDSFDYRYMPEPDLPTLEVSSERVAQQRAALPELPWQCRSRFEAIGVGPENARQIAENPSVAGYFDQAVGHRPREVDPAELAKWLCGEVRHGIKSRGCTIEGAIAPERLADLVAMVEREEVSRAGGRHLLKAAWDAPQAVAAMAEALDLLLVRDEERLLAWIDEVLEEHPGPVEQYRGGRLQVFAFLMGRVMGRSRGRAQPAVTRRLLRRRLGGEALDGVMH